jgi:tRNA-splicing ligase RtcB (3'-phosphate/5'-hydroxy nucleic acid ligase)
MKKLKSKDIVKIGYPKGSIAGMALLTVLRNMKHRSVPEQMAALTEVLAKPAEYLEDTVFGKLAAKLVPTETREAHKPMFQNLNGMPLPYSIFGKKGIADEAISQMDMAMRLPVTVAGSLMPDAHSGYGLPIGGVLATKGVVIPYAVGVDIGCRMSLSVFPLPGTEVRRNRERLKKILIENSRFGPHAFSKGADDPVLHRKEFDEIEPAGNLQDKARKQLGSSGGGNHFVEFCILEVPDNRLGPDAGEYLALLTHSGSRGLGAGLAQHYTRVAQSRCHLPREAGHFAWLDLETEAGQEYWLAMNLAGDYATACHDLIHRKVGKALGEQAVIRIGNHHNFAWKESLADGTEVIVHRKGATPAGEGVMGIIPGSMTMPGFVVRGLANAESLNSASHGAGRKLSREKASSNMTVSEMKKVLMKEKVTLIGGDVDEGPHAYKDIHEVMARQTELVETLATLRPAIVRMDGPNRDW